MSLIPEQAIEKFQELEDHLDPKYSARDVAKAYASIPVSKQILQLLAFTPFPDKNILKTISALNLDKSFNVKPGMSVSENKQFWTKSFAALASYLYPAERKRLENIPYQIAMFSFDLIYNGVDMKKAKKLLQKEKCNHLGSLANSLGGDVWKNSLINRINGDTKNEYIADTLGLRIVELYIDNPNLKLTELMQKANKKGNVEFAMGYKDSSYWKIAKCFVPNKDKPLNFPFNYVPKKIQNMWSGEQNYFRF